MRYRQTDRQTDMQTERQSNSLFLCISICKRLPRHHQGWYTPTKCRCAIPATYVHVWTLYLTDGATHGPRTYSVEDRLLHRLQHGLPSGFHAAEGLPGQMLLLCVCARWHWVRTHSSSHNHTSPPPPSLHAPPSSGGPHTTGRGDV